MAWLWRACLMTGIWVPQTRHGRHSFHQDIFPRRCDSSHAGVDRSAEGPRRRGLYVARGGSICTTGALAPRCRRSHSGRLAALAEITLFPCHDRGNFREFPHHSRAAVRRHCRQPGPASLRRDRPLSARSPPWLRRFEHPGTCGFGFLRCPLPREPRFARRRAQQNAERTGTRLRPQGAPDFGLDRTRFASGASRYAVLLHATARPEKQWPEGDWIALGKALGRNLELVLPWGTDLERARSERIAAQVPGARVPDRAPLDQVAKLIAGAQYVVGVDTGLLHLAAALSVPLVAIFTGTKPSLTGPVGSGPLTVLGANGAPPSVGAVIDAVAKLAR